MKKCLFIMTHLGSGWKKLVEYLKKDPRFDFFQTGHRYRHPEDLGVLTSNPHRRDNSAAIWGDIIFYNEDFTCRDLCRCCYFVFWDHKPDFSDPEFADIFNPRAYYRYRLSGMNGYYVRTKGYAAPVSIWNPDLEDDTFLSAILG